MSEGASKAVLAFEDASFLGALAPVAFIIEDHILDFGVYIVCVCVSVSVATDFLISVFLLLLLLSVLLQSVKVVYTRQD